MSAENDGAESDGNSLQRSDLETCSHCGGDIDGKPSFPSRDIKDDDEGWTVADDPDGPFCSTDCREQALREGR